MTKTPIGIMIALAGFLFAVASATAEEVSAIDRFALWNECRPMDLMVQEMTDDATNIGLTKKTIEVAVRSRLRSARLYSEDNDEAAKSFLYVHANIVGEAHAVGAYYYKIMTDAATALSDTALSWNSGSMGTHVRNSTLLISYISEHVDEFIDEYLRVNADACR